MTMDSEAAAAEAYEELYVSPTCYVQTAENRVSACVVEDIGLGMGVDSSNHIVEEQ